MKSLFIRFLISAGLTVAMMVPTNQVTVVDFMIFILIFLFVSDIAVDIETYFEERKEENE